VVNKLALYVLQTNWQAIPPSRISYFLGETLHRGETLRRGETLLFRGETLRRAGDGLRFGDGDRPRPLDGDRLLEGLLRLLGDRLLEREYDLRRRGGERDLDLLPPLPPPGALLPLQSRDR